MARYKLSRRKNKLNPSKDNLWYAIPAPSRRVTARDLCAEATANTTLSPAELLMALELVAARGLLNTGGVAVVETDRPLEAAPASLVRYDERRYGGTYLTFYSPE